MSDSTLITNFPASRLDAARDAVDAAHARLVKAAVKAGQTAPDAPALVVKAERLIAVCTKCHDLKVMTKMADDCYCGGYLRAYKALDVEVVCSRPALAGWEFMAVVEPMTAGNLVKRVPGSDMEFDLSSYRTGDALSCDHCNAIRKRTETFVVKADGSDPAVAAGTVKKVGRNCLSVFLGGKSAAAILASIGFPTIVRAIGEEGGGGGGGRAVETFDPLEVLTWTAAVIRLDGWVSKAVAANEDKEATATTVGYLLSPPFGFEGYTKWKLAREAYAPTEDDKSKGAAALEWAKGLPGSSDYEYSLMIVAMEPKVESNKLGLLCSAVASYERALGREVARKKLAATSAHVGTVGEKVVVTVTVEKVFDLDGNYGTTHLHKMVDESGNILVWNASNERLDVGTTLTLMGTVKKHSEYKGISETSLTRCKEVAPGTVVKPAKPKKAPKAKPPTHACAGCGCPMVYNGAVCAACTVTPEQDRLANDRKVT